MYKIVNDRTQVVYISCDILYYEQCYFCGCVRLQFFFQVRQQLFNL